MSSPELRATSADGWTGGQASLLRWGLGLVLAIEWAAMSRPFDKGTGTNLWWWDLPARDLAVVGVVFGATLIFAVGRWTRALALALAAYWFWAPVRWWWFGSPLALPLPFDPPHDVVDLRVLALLWVACWPPAPYGSIEARGRPDPAGGWLLGSRYRGLWIAWCAFVTVAAWDLYAVESNRLVQAEKSARHLWPKDVDWTAPSRYTVLVCVLASVVALFGWWRRGRPVAWLASAATLVVVWCQQLTLDLFWPFAWFLATLFDPAWIRPKPGALEVFYDGDCALCQGSVRFAIAEDRLDQVSFGPQAGVTFARIADGRTAAFPDSLVVRAQDDTLVRSAAVLRLLDGLGGAWRVLSVLGRLVPRPLRDVAYDVVARCRKLLGVRAASTCPVSGEHLVTRFLP